MADDFSLSSLQRFLRLLNEDNGGAGIDPQQVTLGNPQTTNEFNRNTKIQVTAKQGSGLTGSRVFYYNRLDLSVVFAQLVPDLLVYADNPTTTLDLLAPILEQHGINIGIDDVRNTSLSGSSVLIQAKQNSIAWIGQVVLTIEPPPVTLEQLIPYGNITGFVYTGETPLYAVADLFLDTRNQLLTLINEALSLALTLTDVSLGAPATIPTDIDGRNTSVLLTALPTSEYVGTKTITYKRLDIGVFLPAGFEITGDLTGVGSTHQVLQLLRDQHGIVLRNDEVVNELVSPFPTSCVLTISNNSEVWAPGSQLNITFPLGHIFLLDNGNYFVMDNGNYLLLD